MEAFPEEGLWILPDDSKYSRRLHRIQRKLDNLSDDEFWDDDNIVDDLRVQVEKGQQRMKGVLTPFITSYHGAHVHVCTLTSMHHVQSQINTRPSN